MPPSRKRGRQWRRNGPYLGVVRILKISAMTVVMIDDANDAPPLLFVAAASIEKGDATANS
jgi:hypothetical protein